MKFSRHLPTQPRRDAWVEIDLGALERNARRLRKHIPQDKALMAIVKADAYGHGAIMVIPTLEASGVSMVGVAAMDEALQIRKAGLEIPILVIGAVPDWAMLSAAEWDVQVTVFERHHLESLAQAYQQTGQPVKVHVKVDTGMHRIGLPWDEATEFIAYCRQQPYIQLEGIFSHLASSANEHSAREQIDRWHHVLTQLEQEAPLPPHIHIANSGGALLYPEARGNLVRMGIAFFGYAEEPGDLGLEPVMSVKGRIVHLQDVPPGTGISYEHTYHTPAGSPSKIATLPLGYADGVPRILSNRIHGLLRGIPVPQVGNITMDQMMFNVTAIPDATVGEVITLIGHAGDRRISMTDWANTAGTIEYELMCGLRVRLPKTYTR